MTDPAPVDPRSRVPLLDLLRGYALLGLAVMNLPDMGLPDGAMPGVGESLADRIARTTSVFIFEGKSLALFSVLFGASFAMVMARWGERGGAPRATWLRRMAILFVLGVLHGVLLWDGDILAFYAICGTVLMFTRRWRVRWLVIMGTVLLGLLVTCWSAIALAARQGEETPTPWQASLHESEPFVEVPEMTGGVLGWWEQGQAAQDQTLIRDGPYVEACLARAKVMSWQLLALGLVALPGTLGHFLYGAALWRLGYFSSAGRTLRRRLGLLGLPGVAIEAMLAWHAFVNHAGEIGIGMWGLHTVGATLMLFGVVAVIDILAERLGPRRWLASVETAGRMSLSCYLGQSIIGMFIFSSLGLRQFGQLSPATIFSLAFAVWITVIVLAVTWNQWFRIGPFEWLWRCGTYCRWVPIRREPA